VTLEVRPITGDNFRDVLDLAVTQEQSAWVAPTARYLAVCAYGGSWHPLGLYADGIPVGFAMWAPDPDHGSHWIGGFLVDGSHQRRGHGRAAMLAIMDHLRRFEGATRFALSYAPDNAVARRLYASLGFVETGEREGDELVARLASTGASPDAGRTNPS
jgi:diamine N-acetyltransferase